MQLGHKAVGTNEKCNAGDHHDQHVDCTDGIGDLTACSCNTVSSKCGNNDFNNNGNKCNDKGVQEALPQSGVSKSFYIVCPVEGIRKTEYVSHVLNRMNGKIQKDIDRKQVEQNREDRNRVTPTGLSLINNAFH